MSNKKVLIKVLCGYSDSNIHFSDLRNLLLKLGFKERIKGSHHIYTKENIEEILNIQSKGHLAKSYQVKQIRNVIIKYNMGEIFNE